MGSESVPGGSVDVTAKTDGAATAGDEPLNGHAAAVSLRGLGVVVDGKELLRDVSIEIPANQITLLVGPSGAGKSVWLRLLGGLHGRDNALKQ